MQSRIQDFKYRAFIQAINHHGKDTVADSRFKCRESCVENIVSKISTYQLESTIYKQLDNDVPLILRLIKFGRSLSGNDHHTAASARTSLFEILSRSEASSRFSTASVSTRHLQYPG